MPGSVPSPGTGTGLSSRHLARLPAGYFGAPAAVGTSAPGHPLSLATTLPPTHWGPGQQRPLPVPVLCILCMPPGPETCRWGWKPWGWHRPLGMVPGRAGGQFRGPAPKPLLQGRGNNPSSSLCSPYWGQRGQGPMEESEEDGEDNEVFLEQLMVQTGQAVPRQELEEQYTVLEELGSGTYGRVVLTEPRDGGSPVVLKLMLKENTEWRAFLREYCITLCLSGHAACIRALPVAFESATHFAFGQELAPAGDLCTLLTPGEGLAEVLVKRCASQLAEALDFMHSRALVHRDVKLDNVLLFDRECRRVKLGDFGLTRLQGSAVRAMSSALPYSPPELCLLQGSDTLELDSSLDVWAFAVLLFCLCTGCFPWAVAASPDPQFEDFSAWQSGAEGREAPPSWQGFAYGAQEMFRRLLRLDPDRRSPAIEVQKYLSLPWLTAQDTGARLDGGDRQEAAAGSPQAPNSQGCAPASGSGGGVRDAAGAGEQGDGSCSSGEGVPTPPAGTLALCH
uniref:Protein kinase domain-containing protein n=1 Tax=Cairina moschata TaxID=8855 RepID=A0A8C3CGI1_CAIMO